MASTKGHLEFELHGEKLARPLASGPSRGQAAREARELAAHQGRRRGGTSGRRRRRARGATGIGQLRPGHRGNSRRGTRLVVQGRQDRAGVRYRRRNRPTADIDPAKLKGAKKASLPDFVEPTLATLVRKAPTGKRWLHEIKFDGYRMQVRIDAGQVKLRTRSGLDWTDRFGKELVTELRALPSESALIDGELVVENASGASDFSAAAGGAGRRPHRRIPSSTRSTCCISTGSICSRSPLVRRKDAVETAPARRAGHRPLQRAFRPGRRHDPQARLPSEPGGFGLEAARCALSVGT